ncbi:Zinc finger MYM-type protein 1, partial [Linum perenne]
EHSFKFREFGERRRRFNPSWFDQYTWLEYSIAEDAAYCLDCYLFRHEIGKKGGGDAFIGQGYTNWTKPDRFDKHVGAVNSVHNDCRRMSGALMQQSQSISVAINKQSDQTKKDYRVRLEASVKCINWLLKHGLPFRGHDESEDSPNRGLFLSLLEFYVSDIEHVKSVVLRNAPKNLQMTSPDIQKDIVHALAHETSKLITKDIGDDFFAILADESRDVSVKEQMGVVLRYVDGKGCVLERFLGVCHVSDTKAISLKKAIESMLVKHGLSISKVRGQGYDGASNMKGELNGLKTLILEESPSAYYIHCFAHRLQLALVAVAQNHDDVSTVTNLVGASCKRQDIIRETQASKIEEAIALGELENGRGLNQEIGIKRPCDTRWGSHFATLVNLETLFSTLVHTLRNLEGDRKATAQASVVLIQLEDFEFAFMLKLMIHVLAITNELSIALQNKDQDIVNAIHLVKVSKRRLQDMRDNGWEVLFQEAVEFCSEQSIEVPNINDIYVRRGKSKRINERVTCLHHFQAEVFYTVIDMQLQEINNRFDEVNCQLLLSMACLSPRDSFKAFDKDKLMQLATFYPNEFPPNAMKFLGHHLNSYICDLPSDDRFKDLKGVDELAKQMVETNKHKLYPSIYLLIKLTLILPVATASVERSFSSMKYIKNELRNRMNDEWLNDAMVTYIEQDLCASLDKEAVIQCFQNMKSRRGSL